MEKITTSKRHISEQVRLAWESAYYCLIEIADDNNFRMNIGSDLSIELEYFEKNGEKYFEIQIRPIMLRLLDKEYNKEIIVVIEGIIKFDCELKNNKLKHNDDEYILQAVDYNTSLEIYIIDEETSDKIKCSHIFGARYELDKGSLDHPFFHAHISDEMNLYNDNAELFKLFLSNEFCKPKNKICGIHQKVRLATAQSDFFSILVQICADHLLPRQGVNIGRSNKKIEKFKELIGACNFFQGVELNFINQKSNCKNCLRSTHWYPK